jgi:hypothetical protein
MSRAAYTIDIRARKKYPSRVVVCLQIITRRVFSTILFFAFSPVHFEAVRKGSQKLINFAVAPPP